MEFDFISEFEGYDNYESVYEGLIKQTIQHLNLKFDPIISVTFVSNKKIHELNRDYRNIDRPTDVISFAFLDTEDDKDSLLKSGQMISLGEIYISLDKAKEQAEEYGHPLDRELKFLFVHGLLHLLGYDHMCEEDEKVMFKLQDKILG